MRRGVGVAVAVLLPMSTMAESATLGKAEALLRALRALHATADALPCDAFVAVAKAVLHVIDELGAAFSPARADVAGNVARLEAACAGDADVYEAVRREKAAGGAAASDSLAKGLLWLKRMLEFVAALLANMARDPSVELAAAASAAYEARLAPFHGFLAYGAFTVVLKLVPYRADFARGLGLADAAAEREALGALAESFPPPLQGVHAFLQAEGLDDPTKV